MWQRCQRKGVICTTRDTGRSVRVANSLEVVSPSISSNGVSETIGTKNSGISDDPSSIHHGGVLHQRDFSTHDSPDEYLTPLSSDGSNTQMLDQWHHVPDVPMQREAPIWDHDFASSWPDGSSQNVGQVGFEVRDLPSSMSDPDSLFLNDSLFVDGMMLDLETVLNPTDGVLSGENTRNENLARDRAEAFHRSLWSVDSFTRTLRGPLLTQNQALGPRKRSKRVQ